MEDILEEIVGEFTTDPADDEATIIKEPGGSWLVDASCNIRELNRAQDWEIPTEGPKTLNGLIVERLEDIPNPGTEFVLDGYPMRIVSVEENRILSVRIRPRVEIDED